jgi:hypothetical protein
MDLIAASKPPPGPSPKTSRPAVTASIPPRRPGQDHPGGGFSGDEGGFSTFMGQEGRQVGDPDGAVDRLEALGVDLELCNAPTGGPPGTTGQAP